MNAQYDLYLQQHRLNVHKGFQWMLENLPELLVDCVARQTEFAHDVSKNEPNEYGRYWVLINNNSKECEIALDLPYNYILEMVCNWWAFSWQKGNLNEIFNWYEEYKEYIKLSPKTRKTVDSILEKMKEKLRVES